MAVIISRRSSCRPNFATASKVASPIAAANSERSPVEGLSDAERIRVLERENVKLREEREILRKAAKYFA